MNESKKQYLNFIILQTIQIHFYELIATNKEIDNQISNIIQNLNEQKFKKIEERIEENKIKNSTIKYNNN